MFAIPVISNWVDMVFIALFLAIITKFVQHITTKPERYFEIKTKSKLINKDMKKLASENKIQEMKDKQKEAFKLVHEQFKMTQKSMILMMFIALPIFIFIRSYYSKIIYNFIIFKVSGIWAYIILGVIFSLIINALYDKVLEKKYTKKEISI